MPVLKISDEAIFELVRQLPREKKDRLVKDLILEEDRGFTEILTIGEKKFEQICRQRGLDAHRMSEREKEALVDEILHGENK